LLRLCGSIAEVVRQHTGVVRHPQISVSQRLLVDRGQRTARSRSSDFWVRRFPAVLTMIALAAIIGAALSQWISETA
jgi:hypothetical protein